MRKGELKRERSARATVRKSLDDVFAEIDAPVAPRLKGPNQPRAAKQLRIDEGQDVRAKLFMSGRSQAVRLPKAFRFNGEEVRVRRVGLGVLLEPVKMSTKAWFAALDQFPHDFMLEGRSQPMPQERGPIE